MTDRDMQEYKLERLVAGNPHLIINRRHMRAPPKKMRDKSWMR